MNLAKVNDASLLIFGAPREKFSMAEVCSTCLRQEVKKVNSFLAVFCLKIVLGQRRIHFVLGRRGRRVQLQHELQLSAGGIWNDG
jgi:hypothetical protein